MSPTVTAVLIGNGVAGGAATRARQAAMTISWACRLTVAEYAAAGASPPVPRPDCGSCGRPMTFDGTYPRRVREAGVEFTVFIRRGRCSPCGVDDALLPDFVVRRRRDSASAIGAAVLGARWIYPPVPPSCTSLCPTGPCGSWRRRFADRAAELTARFEALTASWGTLDWPDRASPSSLSMTASAIAQMWVAAGRRYGRDAIPPAWPLANLITGGQLLGTRVDLPWPIQPNTIGRSRGP